jgi:uncharacterized membrane protein YbaN (DUF454 family)
MSLESPKPGGLRWVYFALGWVFFGLGALGAVLPVLPTTPLMILALWAFSKSSARFQTWLYTHRVFGPPLRRWREHRVIPPAAKLAAVTAMAVSLGYLAGFTAAPLALLVATGGLMLGAAGYIVSRPSRPPATERGTP